jgi:filamentous hemagglutinin family protein
MFISFCFFKKNWNSKLYLLGINMVFSSILQAEAVFDGSIGPNAAGTTLSGDFTIGESDGIVKGNNLFHSLSTFNINTGESASFTHTSSNINNIITRVTGNSNTVIDGSLSSDASLWLLNPNGFIFNDNASLNINGSFHTTTADYLKFSENEHFYANLNENTVLSIAEPTAFGFLDNTIGNISINNSFLQTNTGDTLSLTGGNIAINSSTLSSPEGQISLTAIASSGEVSNIFDIATIENQTDRADITVSDSVIDVRGDRAGNIFILGGELIVEQESSIAGFSLSNAENVNANGQININSDSLQMQEDSQILTITNSNALGNDITIDSQKITILDNSFIKTTTYDEGQAGEIFIETNELTINGETSTISMGILSESEWSGDSGNITITADDIDIFHDGLISTTAFSSGDAGNITVTTNNLNINGESSGFPTGIIAETYSTGDIGNITINAENIDLTQGGAIKNNTRDQGNGGNITITAENVNAINGGQISATTFNTGDGGQITISAEDIFIDEQGGASTGIFAQTVANNNGGDITLTADKIDILGGASISVASFADGNGGNISLQTNQLTINRQGILSFTGLSAQTRDGIGGNITVNAQDTQILNGGAISATVRGSGVGGEVRVTSDQLTVNGDGIVGEAFTGISAQNGGTGTAATIIISAGTADILHGGSISAIAFTEGAGGDIHVQADNLNIDRQGADIFTGITAATNDSAQGGNINLNIGELSIDGNNVARAGITTASYGSGSGGNIIINADNITIANNGGISADTLVSSGNAGDVQINAFNTITLVNSATIASDTLSAGDAGNLIINAEALEQTSSSISSFSQGSGSAGNITITADDIALIDGSSISTETIDGQDINQTSIIQLSGANLLLGGNSSITTSASGNADAGNIIVNTTETIRLLGNSRISTEAVLGGGGQITLITKDLLELTQSTISTSVAEGSGNGGDIFIDPTFIIVGGGSAITANASEGNGGNITLIGDHIIQSPDSLIQASSELGLNGSINITASNFDSTDINELSLSLLDASTFLQHNCEVSHGHSSFNISSNLKETDLMETYHSRKVPIRPITTDKISNEKTFSNDIFAFNSNDFVGHRCWL